MKFVHLATEESGKPIERNGIKGSRVTLTVSSEAQAHLRRGVFCMPILQDFWTTYQWLRELRSWHGQRLMAVQFRIPDDEPVFVGRYGQHHLSVAAAVAAGWVEKNPRGAQVVIPRSIRSSEIHRTHRLPQLVGWTRCPEAERLFDCLCPACLPPGTPDLIRRLRGAFALAVESLRRATNPQEMTEALSRMETPLERARGRLSPRKILAQAKSPHPIVRSALARLLGYFRWDSIEPVIPELLLDGDLQVRESATESVWRALRTLKTVDYLWCDNFEALLFFVTNLLELESNETLQIAALERLVIHERSEIRTASLELAGRLSRDVPEELAPRFRRLYDSVYTRT